MRTRSPLSLVFACIVLVPAAAPAVTLFDNIPGLSVGDPYTAAGHVSVECEFSEPTCAESTFIPDPFTAHQLDWANQFVTPGGPTSWTLDSIELSLALTGGKNEVDIILHEDAGGSPGVILETIRLSGAATPGGVIVEAVSTAQPLLLPGTAYWVEFDVDNLGDPTTTTGMRWAQGTTGADRPLDRQLDSGAWVSSFFAETNSSLRINATAVPEPGAALLLCAGGVALAGRRRRAPGACQEPVPEARHLGREGSHGA